MCRCVERADFPAQESRTTGPHTRAAETIRLISILHSHLFRTRCRVQFTLCVCVCTVTLQRLIIVWRVREASVRNGRNMQQHKTIRINPVAYGYQTNQPTHTHTHRKSVRSIESDIHTRSRHPITLCIQLVSRRRSERCACVYLFSHSSLRKNG